MFSYTTFSLLAFKYIVKFPRNFLLVPWDSLTIIIDAAIIFKTNIS